MTNRKIIAALLSGIAVVSVAPASALDLGVDLGGLGSVDASLDSGGLDVGAEAVGTVGVDASAGPSGIEAGAGVGDTVGGEVSLDSGGLDAGVEAGGGAIDAGVTAGPQGIGVDASAGPPPAPADTAVPGAPAAPGVQPVQPGTQPQGGAPQAAPSAQPAAPAPRATAPAVSRTATTAGITKLTATKPDRRAEALARLLEDSGLSGIDLDKAVDDRRIVIVWLDQLVDTAARKKIYAAIRQGAAGYREVSSAISSSDKVAQVLRRNGIETEDVVAIQIGLDGTTEILVSERARVVMAGDDIPLVWDSFVNAYFPIGNAEVPLWQPAVWNRDVLVSPLLGPVMARSGQPATVDTPRVAAPRIPRIEAVDTGWQGCSAIDGPGPVDIDYLSSRSWARETVGSETVIPGWDMNGVALHALVDDDTARLEAVMAVTGEPDDRFMATGTIDPLSALEPFHQVFSPDSDEWADMVMATHLAVQQVDLRQVAFTEQVATDFAPRPASVTLASIDSAQVSGCDPQTFDTLRSFGMDVVASLDPVQLETPGM